MKAYSAASSALVAGLVALGASALPGAAQETKSGTQPTTVAAPAPVYKPPLRGAPAGRVGGGTRSGSVRDIFVLSALVPEDTGLTVSEQPLLYWFISTATALPVEVAISDPRATQPLLEVRLPSPVQPGLHRIKLADHGVRLAPGVAYRWSVTVISDVNRRSRDILAGGVIERVEAPAGLPEKLAQSRKEEHSFLYAQAGLWYDALASISEMIEVTPYDAQLRKQRSGLLMQVGLPELPDEGGIR
jgi:Domain of Unknown Function (DUF928)